MSTSRATRMMGIVLAALIAFLAAGAARDSAAGEGNARAIPKSIR
jgi:hypothetical protein